MTADICRVISYMLERKIIGEDKEQLRCFLISGKLKVGIIVEKSAIYVGECYNKK